MFFYDDNIYDNKKAFENKYGKLTNSGDIIQDITSKEKNHNIKKKDEEINKIISKKRKRHDSSDEEDQEDEKKNKKEKEKKEENEEFINKINNVNELNDENENEKNNKEKKNEKENENKDSWKKGFIDVEELNKNKIEVKEMSKMLDDPMKNLLSKNKLIEETDDLIKKRGFYLPRCKFPPLINRFNIKPGYRWDGFDRSNGFENKIMNIKFNINN